MVVALGLAGVLLSTVSPTEAGSTADRRAVMLVPKTNHESLRASVYSAFPRAEGRWGAVHVVDRDCTLSSVVIAHLIDRRASTEIDELVIVVDPDGATHRQDIELVHAGYRVRIVMQERASDVVPISMPSMVVARPDGTLAYVGGHRRAVDSNSDATAGFVDRRARIASPPHAGFVDAAIVTELVTTGATTESAPVIGCAR